MKIGLGQINTTPNDFEGNVEKILAAMEKAAAENTHLLVFPELSICGYLCKDLFYRKGFIEKNLQALTQIVNISKKIPGLTTIVGYVGKNNKGTGKPFTNMAAAIRNGSIVARYQKRLLPFYDVFDEGRYFEPGSQPCVIKVPIGSAGGFRKCAITICEDIWNDKGQDDYFYVDNPVGEVEYDVLINISSSPYALNKPTKRFRMLSRISETNKCLLVYVNQIGGQDELVFDGNSCIFNRGSFTASVSDEGLEIYDNVFDLTDTRPVFSPIEEIHRAVLLGLKDYTQKAGFQQVVLGSSGGIDSALVAALACEALGPENVHCIKMPSKHSSHGSLVDAEQLHKNLGCHDYTIPIDHKTYMSRILNEQTVEDWTKHPLFKQKRNPVAEENVQARMRGNIIMYYSNAFGLLALSTGNKTELALGYCTLYGDMSGGFNPIGDLYKDQVYALARHINTKANRELVPEAIITKPPSAELAPGQTDENSLLPYPILNLIVRCFIEHHISSFDDFKNQHAFDGDIYKFSSKRYFNGFYDDRLVMDDVGEVSRGEYNKMIRRIDLMEFKRRQATPCIKISNVAFGTGRRLPIIQTITTG
jgi:NAD+ synthetase